MGEGRGRGVRVSVFVALVAAGGAAALAWSAPELLAAAREDRAALAAFVASTVLLQLIVVAHPRPGAVSFVSVGLLGAGYALGAGPAMACAVVAAGTRLAASRGKLHRAAFDAGMLVLASGAAAAGYAVLGGVDGSLLGAGLFLIVNVGLLSAVISLSDGASPIAVARRFRWMAPYALGAGPLALVVVLVAERVGAVGIVSVALVPAVLMLRLRSRAAFAG